MQDYITTSELADILRIKKNTIERWRTNRVCPIKWTKVGRNVLYDRADVMAYLDSQKTDRVIRKPATPQLEQKPEQKGILELDFDG